MSDIKNGLIRGRITLHPRGFGFLRPTASDHDWPSSSIFLAPPALKGFLAGDLVEGRLSSETKGRFSASDLQLVERSRDRLFGIVKRSGRRIFVRPDPEVANGAWQLDGGGKLGDGTAVIAEIDGTRLTRAKIVPADQMAMSRLLARWSVRGDHHPRLIDRARKSSPRKTPRVDLRDLPTVTIDASTSQDLDDALAVLPPQNDGSIRVLVSIADVDAFVEEDSPLDREARLRGTSVYLADRVIPMFPRALSEKRASLLPGVERPALTVELRIDPEGEIRSVDLRKTTIRSNARVSYDEAAAFLDHGRESEVPEELHGTLRLLRAAAGRLSASRAGRGGLTFVREEAQLSFDPGTHEPIDIHARVEQSSHRLVERLMVAANEAVARWLDERGLPTLYRVHDAPDAEQVAKLATFAANFGFETAFGPEMTGRSLAAFEDQYRSSKAGAAIRTVVQKALGPARYTVHPSQHFGLGAPLYLHFTSPIRRYADLVVHRVIKRHLRGTRSLDAEERELELLAQDLNEKSFRAAKAEAERLRALTARLFADRVGESFEGNVIGVKPFGLLVHLTGFGVTGLIPVESLPGKDYSIADNLVEFVSSDATSRFAVGNELSVEVRAADQEEGKIEFSLASPTTKKETR